VKKVLLGIIVPVLALLGAAFSTAPGKITAAPTQIQNILIQNPRPGQPLQGIETIEGRVRGDGFQSGTLHFAYSGVENPTWFYLADLEPAEDSGSNHPFLVEWDTSQITDGDYDLRLKAYFEDQVTLSERVRVLRVRNYTVIETSTPAPDVTRAPLPTSTRVVSETQAAVRASTLPENPAAIEIEDFQRSLGFGLASAAGLFVVGGIYFTVKRLRKNRFKKR
jgi:hypothetical protein